MSEQLHQLVYTSKAKLPITFKEITDINTQAKTNNKGKNLTGVLLYQDGCFLQLLEGNKETIHDTFKKISKDRRHNTVKILVDKPVNKRHFPNWDMTLKSIQVLDPALAAKVVSLLKDESTEPNEVLNALWSFYEKQSE